jgi:hypothetical protein
VPSWKSGITPLFSWPPGAEPYYRPSLSVAIGASVGVMVGSVGPWLTALIFTVNGLDAGNWGVAALTLGGVSCIALLTVLLWPRTPFHPRWAVPVAWAVVVAGVACLTFSLPFLIRIMTSRKANFFGLSIGPGVGWGLWLLAFASAVLCAAASIVATQLAKSGQLLQTPARSDTSWTSGWRWVAIIASLVVAIANVVYASLNWNGSGGSEALREDVSFSSSTDIRDALKKAGLACTGYKPVATKDREWGMEGASDVGDCDLENENIRMVVWKDKGQKDNWVGMGKTMLCGTGKALGISSVDYVDGGLWTVSDVTQTLAKKISDAIGGMPEHVACG